MNDEHDELQEGLADAVTDDVLEQLAEVRETGLTNMMNREGVKTIADSLGFTQLMNFCDFVGGLPKMDRSGVWMNALTRMADQR